MVLVRCRSWLVGISACVLAAASPARADDALPVEVQQVLQRARVPDSALVALVQELGSTRNRLSWRAGEPVNPASLAKLFTTAAALDQLGSAYTWATPVWLSGSVQDGVLDGSLHIKGSGDPKLVYERLWLLLRRVQQLGVREIRGDVVLDNSAFAPAEGTTADFDGEAIRPYNARAEALLLNFKAVLYGFVPDAARGIARVVVEPPLAGAQVDRSVPLTGGACDDWRGALKATFGEQRVRFAGNYPLSCGEQVWPLADPAPATYNARLIEGLWREMGGVLTGRVRDGAAPEGKPSFEQRSPPLVEVVREVNKFSNNVMAQQLFLTLALNQEPGRPASGAAAREHLRRWVTARLGEPGAELVIDNGSGLSREGRASARLMARLLQLAQGGAWAAEFASSLPIAGVDGTLRRSRSGRAHLKTGSLRDVIGVAGYVLADNGRRYVLVAVINHPQAHAARAALDALVQWTQR